MKRERAIILLLLILVMYLAASLHMHKKKMAHFRDSVRYLQVHATALENQTGTKLPCQLGYSSHGEDLGGYSTWSDGEKGMWGSILTTEAKMFFVSSPGFSTQEFMVVTSTNITATLNRLDKPSNKPSEATR